MPHGQTQVRRASQLTNNETGVKYELQLSRHGAADDDATG